MNYYKKINESDVTLISIYDNHERDKAINLEKLYVSLDDIDKKINYNFKNNKDIKPIKYQGQIKLLLSEIEFFSIIEINKLTPITIVYAGCSPFTHGIKLLEFYKTFDIKWILIDPRPIDVRYKKFKKSIFIKGYLTEDLCKEIIKNNSNIILISDIRSSDNRAVSSTDIYNDQELNNVFVKILKPIYSLLKFRYPFPDVYLDIMIPVPNKCYLQAFSKLDSTESRMLINNKSKLSKSNLEDSIEYEQKFSYYTTHIKRFKIINKDYENMMKEWNCMCYDCVLMFNIFDNFKKINKLTMSLKEIADYFLIDLK
jgi:hypothetical protein